jgi:8-oxo-dGTP pyrophosphatase MutT (NUDIX family)
LKKSGAASDFPTKETLVPRALRPRDAATLVIFDASGGETRILTGRRRLDQVFLPGHYVFPGGRVDRADRRLILATALTQQTSDLLMLGMAGRPSQARATALALAAIRETFEETGLVIGEPATPCRDAAKLSKSSWCGFQETGYAPALGALHYFARAITPPGRPRRYDTRFFAVSRDAVSGPYTAGDGELEDTGWRTIAEVKRLKLPSITRLVLEDFADLLDRLAVQAIPLQPRVPTPGVPFYFQKNGSFQRVVLSREAAVP